MKASPRRCIRSGTENGGEIRGTAGGCPLGHYGRWAAAAMEIMAVTVIMVCAADRYLSLIVSNAACTEILRRRLRMTVSGGKSRNAVFILIARQGDTTTL